MGLARLIVENPWAVIAAWIIIAIVSFPLFTSLHNVVKEQVYSLPETSEASKAARLAEEVNGKGGTHTGVIIVDGIDLENNNTILELVGVGEELNRTIIGHYASKITGIPVILAETNKTLYRAMLEALNASSTGAEKLYTALDRLDKAYAAALENTTRQVEELNQTVAGIMAADKGYQEAYRGLLGLRDALNKTMEAAMGLDQAYREATDRLESLAENITVLAEAIRRADKGYAGLYQNLTIGAGRLLALLSNKTLVGAMEGQIGYTWWQASRAYYYLELYHGNYTLYTRTANLSAMDPRLAPLPEDQAITAWRLVAGLVKAGRNVDEASLAAAAKLLQGQAAGGEAGRILPLLVSAWNATMNAYKASTNTSCIACLYRGGEEAAQSQLLVLGIAENISRKAADYTTSNAKTLAVEVLTAMLSSKGVPREEALELAREAVEGNLNTTRVALVVASMAPGNATGMPPEAAGLLASILAHYDPGAEGVIAGNRSLGLRAAADLLEAMGAPRDTVEQLVGLLARNETSRQSIAGLAAKIVASKAGDRARHLMEAVARTDPEARGILAENKTLAALVAAQVVYNAAKAEGKQVDRETVEKIALLLARGGAGDDEIRRLALEVLREKIAEERGEEAASLIVEVLEKYDPGAKGLLAGNKTLALKAVYELAERQGHPIPLSLAELERALEDPSTIRSIVSKMFVEMSAEKAPKGMENTTRLLAERVVEEGPGIPVEEKWRIVEQLLLEKAENMGAGRGGLEIPAGFGRRLVRLALMVARGELGLGEAASQAARDLLLGQVAPKLLNETRGLMASKGLDAFTLLVTPLGGSQEERARNIEAAGNATREILGRHGLGARVYVSGEDVVLQQVRHYAVRDAEKTSMLSEIGIFIVLLVLLESILAVFLPYIGIVLGLAVGGAIVYLAALNGFIDFSSHTQSIMMTTALGLGADYAGYLVHRFREEYAATGDAKRAARRSLERAGPAIVASALTVIIGFGSLLLAWDISFLRGFGEAIPIAVAATAAATLTLVPALLAVVGGKTWFWWPRRPRREKLLARRSRVMESLIRHEKLVLAAMAALIIVSGYFYATFHGTHDMKLMLPEDAPALKAFNIMSEKFEPGITDPVIVVVETNNSIWHDSRAWSRVEGLAARLAGVEGVARVLGPTRPMGRPVDNATLAEEMGGKAFTSSDGRIALLQVVLAVDPYSRSGEKAVEEIHRAAHGFGEKEGLRVYVDGSPYATLEMDSILSNEFYYRVLPGAAILMIIVFTAVFGGLWVSIAALVVIIGAAMTGIMAATLLFQYIYGKEMLWFMHIVTLAAVMGVGMDYNSFFLARALEECHRTGCRPRESVVRASGAVSLFIIGLSLVVTTAYAMLLAASNTGMREMGFALAVTVFTAALMASYLLTPIVVSLLGRRAWWPWGLRRKIAH